MRIVTSQYVSSCPYAADVPDLRPARHAVWYGVSSCGSRPQTDRGRLSELPFVAAASRVVAASHGHSWLPPAPTSSHPNPRPRRRSCTSFQSTGSSRARPLQDLQVPAHKRSFVCIYRCSPRHYYGILSYDVAMASMLSGSLRLSCPVTWAGVTTCQSTLVHRYVWLARGYARRDMCSCHPPHNSHRTRLCSPRHPPLTVPVLAASSNTSTS
jgi:hypothetical protein